MYNFDFPGAHALIDQHVNDEPQDPLGYSTRAAALVFQDQLDRLRILQADFFLDDDRIAEKKKLRPDPETRDAFYWATRQAQERADSILLENPTDASAFFANSLAWGLTTDYAAFVEKRQLTSLSYAKTSHSYAKRLITVDKSFGDAYLTTGPQRVHPRQPPLLCQMVRQVRRHQRLQAVAIENLNRRQKRPLSRPLRPHPPRRRRPPRKEEPEARDWLHGLVRDYPENPLLKHELERLR
jgi:hypothetical protein